MDAPDATVGATGDGNMAKATLDQARQSVPSGPAADGPSLQPTAGDRILANLTRDRANVATESGPVVAGPSGTEPSIDIGRPMDRLELEMQVAEFKAETGLAVSATQKTSQGVDTLLKSQ